MWHGLSQNRKLNAEKLAVTFCVHMEVRQCDSLPNPTMMVCLLKRDFRGHHFFFILSHSHVWALQNKCSTIRLVNCSVLSILFKTRPSGFFFLGGGWGQGGRLVIRMCYYPERALFCHSLRWDIYLYVGICLVSHGHCLNIPSCTARFYFFYMSVGCHDTFANNILFAYVNGSSSYLFFDKVVIKAI